MCPGKLSKIETGHLRSDSNIFNTAIIGHHFEHYSILNSFETAGTDFELQPSLYSYRRFDVSDCNQEIHSVRLINCTQRCLKHEIVVDYKTK